MLNIFGLYSENQIKKFIHPKSENITILWDYKNIPETDDKIIYIQVEPESIIPQEDFLLENYKKFYKILTFNQNIIEKCYNSILAPFATCWIKGDQTKININDKKFAISSITGDKLKTHGHFLRIILYIKQKEISIPHLFFRSNRGTLLPEIQLNYNPILNGKKNNLFTLFQFSLVIENSRQDNYFSEKLIDCLITKTIPIFYGAPNINKYFDTTGWIILENDNYKEAIKKINSISRDHYKKYLHIVEKNYQTCIDKNYISHHIIRYNEILKTLPEF